VWGSHTVGSPVRLYKEGRVGYERPRSRDTRCSTRMRTIKDRFATARGRSLVGTNGANEDEAREVRSARAMYGRTEGSLQHADRGHEAAASRLANW